MLHELVRFGDRRATNMTPLGYRNMEPIRWALDVADDGPPALYPIEVDKPRPSLNRSSGVEPLLLADTAEYVLGMPKSPSERDATRAKKAFDAFWALVERAERETGDEELRGLSRARDRLPPIPSDLKPKDVVLVRRTGRGVPLERATVQDYWRRYLESLFVGNEEAQCGTCGETKRLLRILPTGVKGFPQDVKLTSVNPEQNAFESYGLKQLQNAPLCFRCGLLASSALSDLMESRQNRMTLATDGGGGLGTEHAIYWLKDGGSVLAEGQPVDFSLLLHAISTGFLPTEDRPPPGVALSQAAALLRAPWTARDPSLLSDPDAFHMGVVSANVSRLVVRAWMHASLRDLQHRLTRYLDATMVIGPWGEEPAPLPLRTLLDALGAFKIDAERKRWESTFPPPALVRSLLATAYEGRPAPRSLAAQAARVLRNPNAWLVDRLAHALVSSITLERTLSERSTMNTTAPTPVAEMYPARLCGRLFAVLERAQGVASNWKLNTTIVERSYGAASSRPRLTFAPLLRLASTAHLPRAPWLKRDVEELLAALGPTGFPTTLTLDEQADFAIGFYEQRAHYRANSKKSKEKEDDENEAH